ncbi:Homeodomain-like domain-containing protein [Amycolatopsis echigonensis]|uniref:Homeodomain-like domain-containing protein n=1 Tax=Amycolatopsis echigonensis TaxID=2576905 RepID=A0A2N3WPV8_9PSEU|nr:helix-turn-helix domain-containing protein [Amycolatopsis niigatensis]PKV95908.1 Homeodomain-like domain-containing protein [Amycolatopsis niigatensis]
MANPGQSRGNRAELAEKRAEAYRLKLRGLSDRAVGAQLGVSHTSVQNWIKQEADERVLPLADEYRKVQLERLGEMRQAALLVLERFHYTVSQGRVMNDLDGLPIEDDAPQLAAIDRLLRIEERIARLLGLDAPTRAEVEARVDSRPAELLAKVEAARAAVAAQETALRDGDE